MTREKIASALMSETPASDGLITSIFSYNSLPGGKLAEYGVTARHVFWHLEHTPQKRRKIGFTKERYLRWLRQVFQDLGGYPAVHAAKQAASAK